MGDREYEEKRDYIIERLAKHGIKVEKRKRKPKNGQYSGIVGKKREKIYINR